MRPKPAARQHGGHGSGIRRLACMPSSSAVVRVPGCHCGICNQFLPGTLPGFIRGKCVTCYEDVTEALRSAIHSPSSTDDDKLAYIWVYFGLDWWKCNDCQDIMRKFTTECGSADKKISASDDFPRGPAHHPGVSVRLSATGDVVTLAPTYQLSAGIRIVRRTQVVYQ